jgi:hypothetical protein
MEAQGQSEAKRLVEVKLAGIQRNGSGPGTCTLDVVLAEGCRIEVRRDFDAETLARLIRTHLAGTRYMDWRAVGNGCLLVRTDVAAALLNIREKS